MMLTTTLPLRGLLPDMARINRARNLIQDAAATPELEFVARLLAGVRGDARTGLQNPLSGEDLRSLLIWHRQANGSIDLERP
jgi:IS5 family transposase